MQIIVFALGCCGGPTPAHTPEPAETLLCIDLHYFPMMIVVVVVVEVIVLVFAEDLPFKIVGK